MAEANSSIAEHARTKDGPPAADAADGVSSQEHVHDEELKDDQHLEGAGVGCNLARARGSDSDSERWLSKS